MRLLAELTMRAGHKALEWQCDYGVVSFGHKHLPWIVDCIRRQPEHHAKGRVFARLEIYEVDEQTGDTGSAVPEKSG